MWPLSLFIESQTRPKEERIFAQKETDGLQILYITRLMHSHPTYPHPIHTHSAHPAHPAQPDPDTQHTHT